MVEDLHALARRKVKQYTKAGPAGFIAFCDECVRVMGGDSEWVTTTVPFSLWPAQEEFARLLTEKRNIVCLKARQLGMTTEVLAFFLFRALYWDNEEFLIISINENEAKKSLDRIKLMIQNLPEWTAPTLEVANTTTVKIGETGSVIRVQASTRNAGRGTTVSGVLLDEDAAQVYSDEIFLAAMPALEKRKGWMIRLSTANGVGNSFHRCWVQAEQGRNGFSPFFLDWRADPSRDDEWYAGQLEQHGKEYVSQEYPRNAVEAFLASGRPFFEMERVARDLAKPSEAWTDGYLDGNELVPQYRGALRVWEKPKAGVKYAIFVDVAEGLESGDWSVGYVKEVGGSAEVARVRLKCDPSELADVLWDLGHWYGYKTVGQYEKEDHPALLAVESNNQGLVTLLRLRERGYRRLFFQRDMVTGQIKDKPGWLTTTPSRRLMLGTFQAGYRTGAAVVRDRDCLEEMGNFFHRGEAGKAQAGPGQHDDCVMARAGLEVIAALEAQPDEKMSVFEVLPGLKPTGAKYWLERDVERSKRDMREEGERLVEI